MSIKLVNAENILAKKYSTITYLKIKVEIEMKWKTGFFLQNVLQNTHTPSSVVIKIKWNCTYSKFTFFSKMLQFIDES